MPTSIQESALLLPVETSLLGRMRFIIFFSSFRYGNMGRGYIMFLEFVIWQEGFMPGLPRTGIDCQANVKPISVNFLIWDNPRIQSDEQRCRVSEP